MQRIGAHKVETYAPTSDDRWTQATEVPNTTISLCTDLRNDISDLRKQLPPF